jgi:hypothetical protein
LVAATGLAVLWPLLAIVFLYVGIGLTGHLRWAWATPRAQRDRAAALGYYCCAPLAVTGAALVLIAWPFAFGSLDTGRTAFTAIVATASKVSVALGGLALLTLIFLTWWRSTQLAQSTSLLRRAFLMTIVIPLRLLGLLVLLIATGWIIGYITLVIGSLTW